MLVILFFFSFLAIVLNLNKKSIILMVNYMLKNNNVYKSSDIVNDNFINRMNSYFNPYEYNLDSNLKNNINNDLISMKSKSHSERNKIKK